MSGIAKYSLGIGLLLVGALVGAGVTFYYVVSPLSAGIMRATLQAAQSEAYARYRFGEYPHARRALLLHAQLAEVAVSEEGPDEKCGTQSALAMSYARLAVLARRAGEVADQRMFASRAIASCCDPGEIATEDDLNALVARFDEQWNVAFKDIR